MTRDPADLLAHTGEIRRLARHLIGDATLADDLTQDTWVAALQGRPAEGVPTHRWLAAVLRNLVRQQRRTDARRRERETRAATQGPAGGSPGAPASMERLEAHRTVVDAVAALHEPYRSAVVMRYFDGLAPRAIAAREGVAVRTVHTRLHRALALLRQRLRRPGGVELGAWLPLLLLPPAATSAGLLGTAAGAVLMNAKTKLAAGALLLAGLVTVSLPLLRSAEPDVAAAAETPAPAVLDAPAEVAPAPAPTTNPSPATAREQVAAPPQTAVPAATPVAAVVRGRAIDVDGAAVGGLAIVHESREGERSEVIRTDADGTFELAVEDPEGRVRSADERWISVLEPMLWNTDRVAVAGWSTRNVLVVAPALRVAGEVVDASGAPVAGARLEVHAPFDLRTRLPVVLDGSQARSWFATADEAGRFELDAAQIERAMLRTWHAGFADDLRPLPALPTYDLRIVLEDASDRSTHLRGRVVDATGLGVADARVALGYGHTRTTADGTFVLAVNERDEPGTLAALKPGYLPTFLERDGTSNADPDAWPDPLVLELGGTPLEISGRVVDADGPVSGVTVEIVDRTDFGPVEIPGRAGITSAGFVEPLLRGELDTHSSALASGTGSDGRFRIEGLLPRDYTLSVIDRERTLYREFPSIAAGRSGVELVLPAEAVRDVGGHIVGLSGDPIAGLTVTAVRRRPADSPLAGSPWADIVWGAYVHTDGEGAFLFEDLSVEVATLQISGPAVGLGRLVEIPPGADPEHLRFELPLRCHVQVDLAGSAVEADQFSLLGRDGTAMTLGMFHGDFAYSTERARIHEGRSEVVSVGEDGETLVLYRDGEEVLRQPVELAAGERNVLTP